MGLQFRAAAVVLTVGTFLGGRIHIGLEKLRRRPRRRPAGQCPGAAVEGVAVSRRAAQDRYAAPHRPSQHRLLRPPGATRATTRCPGVLFFGICRRASRPGKLPHHAHQRTYPRDHPRRTFPFADVYRGHRGGRAPILSLYRRQGGAFFRQGFAPDFHRAGRARQQRGLSQRHLHLPAL